MLFPDECQWDTPQSVKKLNETIFKQSVCYTAHNKRSHVASDRKLSGTNFSCSKKSLAKRRDSERGPQARKELSSIPTDCSPGHTQKNKHKKRLFVFSNNDDGSCSAAAIKPHTKSIKPIEKTLKLACINTKSNSSVLPAGGNSELSQTTCVPKKKRKRKHTVEADSVVKHKKSRNSDNTSESNMVRSVSDKQSNGPHRHNFNIDQLRSALQQHGKKLNPTSVSRQSCSASNKRTLPDGPTTKVCTSAAETGDESLCTDTVAVSRSGNLLKDRMTNRLASARFRFINEQLYRSTGIEAAEMFAQDKDAFAVYHAGFQSQVSKWPTNPVDKVIEFIYSSGSDAVVADFGCGDAKIARSVPHRVHSFDLVALNEHVTACDMVHVPLKKASVDIAVFCLSLMGTNIVQYLAEASRVLKPGGVLLIAEVVSRFEKIGTFVRKLHKLGFALENKVVDKMFVWFELKKISALPPENCMPTLELAPCVYKKR